MATFADANERRISFNHFWNGRTDQADRLAAAGFYALPGGHFVQCYHCDHTFTGEANAILHSHETVGIDCPNLAQRMRPRRSLMTHRHLWNNVQFNQEESSSDSSPEPEDLPPPMPQLDNIPNIANLQLNYIPLPTMSSSSSSIQALTPPLTPRGSPNQLVPLTAPAIPRPPPSYFADFSSLSKRVQSFITKPRSFVQNTDDLALSGFYYVGPNDQVRCFQCKLFLGTWDNQDDPWQQHSFYAPGCPYLIDMKGRHFVQNTVALMSRIQTLEDLISSVLNRPSAADHNRRYCSICLVAKSDTVFIPCGHVSCCARCSSQLLNRDPLCPICRRDITSHHLVYFV